MSPVGQIQKALRSSSVAAALRPGGSIRAWTSTISRLGRESSLSRYRNGRPSVLVLGADDAGLLVAARRFAGTLPHTHTLSSTHLNDVRDDVVEALNAAGVQAEVRLPEAWVQSDKAGIARVVAELVVDGPSVDTVSAVAIARRALGRTRGHCGGHRGGHCVCRFGRVRVSRARYPRGEGHRAGGHRDRRTVRCVRRARTSGAGPGQAGAAGRNGR